MLGILHEYHHSTMLHVLLLIIASLVPQVHTFHWRGVYSGVQKSRRDSYPTGNPDQLWRIVRRRNLSPEANLEKDRLYGADSTELGGEDISSELDNRITQMPAPSIYQPLLTKLQNLRTPFSWPYSSQYPSLDYSSPVLDTHSGSSVNRRGKAIKIPGNDEEILDNIISQVLEERQMPTFGSHFDSEASRSARVPPREHKEQSSHRVSSVEALGKIGSSSRPLSSSLGLSRLDTGFSPDNSHAGYPSLGDWSFGAFVDTVREPSLFSSGFEEPKTFQVQPVQPGEDDEPGFQSSSAGVFGNFADTDVGLFGWKDPSSSEKNGGLFGGIQPIPTALSGSLRSFDEDDRDCDSILTKTCTNDSECLCYGFYYCSQDKCKDRTSSSSSGGAVTFGEEWHDGPAQTLGLSGRR